MILETHPKLQDQNGGKLFMNVYHLLSELYISPMRLMVKFLV